MSELLGVVLGLAIGVGVSRVHSRRLRAVLVVPTVLVAAVMTSAVNGELSSGLWPVFVSFDTLLAGLGVMLGFAVPRLPVALGLRPRRQGG